MEIKQIKSTLSITEVIQNYGLKVNKNKMVNCPFHEDKTPSMQISTARNLYKCHGCDKKGDVIQFVQDYEKLTKHEALLKCTELVEGQKSKVASQKTIKTEQITDHPQRTTFLTKMFLSFRKGLLCSDPAKSYCQSRNIDFEQLEIGFNAGQFHHGMRKDEKLINDCLQYGLLSLGGTNSRTGGQAYKPFGNRSIVFPLKNKYNQIVSFYFRSTIVPPSGAEGAKHFYLKNRQGLYPNYPKATTKKLILTEAIIDAASLLQLTEINKNYSILACFGTNGLSEEHLQAIKIWAESAPSPSGRAGEGLEIIFFFDGDKPGNEAVKKYQNQLKTLNLKLTISQVQTPDYEDANSLIIGHEKEILIHLIDERKPITTEKANPTLGNFATLRETENKDNKKEVLDDLDKPQTPPSGVGGLDFLKQPNLLQEINKLIEQSGIIGEENSRLLLFIIASSYKTKSPLHAIVQGSSGSGKTHLISKIADLIPQEDVLRFTRITESSLYNWGEYELVNKLLVIEDLDGLKEEAMFAMRELISNQRLSSSVSIKDKKGNIKSTKKEVKGIFSSLSATTKGEIYEDNMSRSFLLAVDESQEQSRRIIDNQNKKYAGEIDPKDQEKARYKLQQIIRNLKPYEVINPYATRLELPQEVHKIRRLNEMFQSIVKQITIINQANRQLKNDKIVTEIQDLEQATEVLFESIILKVDELDGSLRQFFERLKKHLKSQENQFTQREIRQVFNMSKSQTHRYLQNLLELEYIRQIGGFANKGLKYKVDYWDDYQKLRTKIKTKLIAQIDNLKTN
jgi:DNA primase